MSLGLSFHDDESLVEAIGSLQFATDNPNLIQRTGSMDQNDSLQIGDDHLNPLSDMDQERRDEEICGSGDIEIVERNRKTVSYSSDELLWVRCVNEL